MATAATSTAAPPAAPRRTSFGQALRSMPILGPTLALILACIFFTFIPQAHGRFLSGGNFSLIVQQVMVTGTLAIGQTLIILTGGIDLSNGMIMALSSVVMTVLTRAGVDPTLAIAAGLAVCLVFGFVNGGLTTWIGLPPFIVTLGTYSIAFSLVRLVTTETIDKVPPAVEFLGNTFLIGSVPISYGTIVMVLLFLIGGFVLRATPAGRAVYAVGDNPEAARLAGIHTGRVLITVYIVAAISYGIAGMLLVGRMGSGDPNAGQNGNLDSITAVVLGGTSLLGGRGTFIGTLAGAGLSVQVLNATVFLGLDQKWQYIFQGLLIVAAAIIYSQVRRGAAGTPAHA